MANSFVAKGCVPAVSTSIFRRTHTVLDLQVPVTGADKQRLLTDRSAYISFLEVQLERVTAAVLTAQGFSQRIDDQQHQVIDAHTKIVNLTKLIQLAQGYSEKIGQETSTQITAVGNRASKVDTYCESLQHKAAAADSKLQQVAETQAKHSEGLSSLHSSLDSLNGAISGRDSAMDALSRRLTDAVSSMAPVSALRAVQVQAAEATKNTDAAAHKAGTAENAAVVAREAAEDAAGRATAAERAATAAAGSAAEAQERADNALEKAVKAARGLDELDPRVSGVAAVADRCLARCEDFSASLSGVRGHTEAVEGELRAGLRRCVLSSDFLALFQQALREEGVPAALSGLQGEQATAADGRASLASALEQEKARAMGEQARMQSEIASLKGALAQRDERLGAIEERLASLGNGVATAGGAAASALQRAEAAQESSVAAASAVEGRVQAALGRMQEQLQGAQRASERSQEQLQAAVHSAVHELTPAGDLETRCSALESVVEELMHSSGVAPSGSSSALASPRWQRPGGGAQRAAGARGLSALGDQVSMLSHGTAVASSQQLQEVQQAVAALGRDVGALGRDVGGLQSEQDRLAATQEAMLRRMASSQGAAQAAAVPPPRHPLHPGSSPSTSVAMSQSVSPVHSSSSSIHQLHSTAGHSDWHAQQREPWRPAASSLYSSQLSSDPNHGTQPAATPGAGDASHRALQNSQELHAMREQLSSLEAGMGELAEQLNAAVQHSAGERRGLAQQLQGTQDSLRTLADESVARASNNAEIVLQALRTMEGRVSTRLEGVSPSAVRAVVQTESGAAIQALRGSMESLRSTMQRVDGAGQECSSRLAGAEEALQGLLRAAGRANGEQGGNTLSSAARSSIVQDISAQLKGDLASSEARLARQSACVLDDWQRGQRSELAGVVARTESLAAQVATSLSQLDRAMGMYHALAAHVYGGSAPRGVGVMVGGQAVSSRTVQATATPPRTVTHTGDTHVHAGIMPLSTGTQRPPLSPPGAMLRPRPPAAPVLQPPSTSGLQAQPQDTPPGFTPTMRVPSTAGSAASSRAASPGAQQQGGALPPRQRPSGKAGPPAPTTKAKSATRGKTAKGGTMLRSTTARTGSSSRSAAERRAGGKQRA